MSLLETHHDLWSKHKFSSEDKPREIIRRIENDILTIRNKITSEKIKSPLIIVGNKSNILMNPHKNILRDRGYAPYKYSNLDDDCLEYSPQLPKGTSQVYIFADSIRTGTEIKQLVLDCLGEKIKILKVFTYLVNKDGMNNVIDQGIITDERLFDTLYSSENINEYQDIYNYLMMMYASDIAPLNPYSSYDIYNINISVSIIMLNTILSKIMSNYFNKIINFEEHKSDIYPPATKYTRALIVDGINSKVYFDILFRNIKSVNINSILIGCKINQHQNGSSFSIKIKSDVYADLAACNTRIIIRDKSKCFLEHWDVKDYTVKEPLNHLCLPCLDHIISDYLLSCISEEIVDAFSDSGIDCRLEDKIRPIIVREK